LYLRFDSLILPSGVTRDFRAQLGGIDGSNNEKLDRTEGKVTGEGNKSGDATKIAEAAGWGTAVGGIAARTATGAGLGAAAGAAAGLVGVLLSRGPDAVLERGSTVEMVLDRNLRYTEQEVASNPSAGRSGVIPEQQRPKSSGWLRQ
jgi:type IV secretion system protein VirB10